MSKNYYSLCRNRQKNAEIARDFTILVVSSFNLGISYVVCLYRGGLRGLRHVMRQLMIIHNECERERKRETEPLLAVIWEVDRLFLFLNFCTIIFYAPENKCNQGITGKINSFFAITIIKWLNFQLNSSSVN